MGRVNPWHIPLQPYAFNGLNQYKVQKRSEDFSMDLGTIPFKYMLFKGIHQVFATQCVLFHGCTPEIAPLTTYGSEDSRDE